jgi:hypothetical protein
MVEQLDSGRVQVEVKRDVHTYAEVWHASQSMLNIASESKRGQQRLFMASVIFTSFTFEAYLNHIGPEVDPTWTEKKRDRMWIRNKFDHLSQILSVPWAGEWKAEPLRTVDEVIRFRNAMAHAQSETLEPPPSLHPVDKNPLDDPFYRPLTEWEKKLADDRFARAARDAVEAALSALHAARTDRNKERLFVMGGTEASATLVVPGG